VPRCCDFESAFAWRREHGGDAEDYRRAHRRHHDEFVDGTATSRLPKIDFGAQVIGILFHLIARLEVAHLRRHPEDAEALAPVNEAHALIRSSIKEPRG
jgi:hypothetical protein